MEKGKFINLNLNTVISGVAVILIAAACVNQWTLNANMVKVQANQEAMAVILREVMPRSEVETRFRGLDRDIVDLKGRQQATELEIIKLRDRR